MCIYNYIRINARHLFCSRRRRRGGGFAQLCETSCFYCDADEVCIYIHVADNGRFLPELFRENYALVYYKYMCVRVWHIVVVGAHVFTREPEEKFSRDAVCGNDVYTYTYYILLQREKIARRARKEGFVMPEEADLSDFELNWAPIVWLQRAHTWEEANKHIL